MSAPPAVGIGDLVSINARISAPASDKIPVPRRGTVASHTVSLEPPTQVAS